MNFETEWEQLKQHGTHGSFTFKGDSSEWDSTVREHFRTRELPRPSYGVYLVRNKSTREVIYIGKSGTMCQNGTFKDQDMQRRLVNKEKGERRQVIFGQRVAKHGELLIEYVILRSRELLPGYLEGHMLQAYFRDYGRLPLDNAAF